MDINTDMKMHITDKPFNNHFDYFNQIINDHLSSLKKTFNISLRGELILIIILVYFFNIKAGIILTILYGLIYVLEQSTNGKKDYMDKKLTISESKCRKPTMNNPYGNYNMYEDPNLKACIQKEDNINNINFNQFNVYENAKEKTVGSFNKSLRDFYVTPTTEYPNNESDFAKWLYRDTNLTCKNDNNCLRFDDVRYHSR